MELTQTRTLAAVPIFDVSTWNGNGNTAAELDGMVAAFTELKGTLEPPVKFGRGDQDLLEREDYPAAGSVERLYRKGTQLVADITRVPVRTADLIDAGAYRSISSEILSGANFNGKSYPKLLAGVAFHDGALPAARAVDGRIGLTHRSITFAARTAPQEERQMPTTADAPTGIHAAIGAVGLSRDASAEEVVRRIARIETTPRESLTQTERDSMTAVRRAFGLAANAQSGEVLTALNAKLTYARTGNGPRPQLVFQDRHEASGKRVDLEMPTRILEALDLPADAGPGAVLEAIQAIEAARALAATEATNELFALEQLRKLLGLDAGASDDIVVDAIREQLAAPAVIDAAILARKLSPSLRGWAEDFAAKQGIDALRKFVAASGPYAVGSDEILSDGAHEIARWSRGRVDFSEAMTQFARAHPEVTRAYLARRWS